MPRPRLEVADIVRSHAHELVTARGSQFTRAEQRILSAITTCRTAALGGHVRRCDRCDHEAISYNSCRNRHCPKCQAAARAEWMAARQRDLLPVEYFHVVFTVPQPVSTLALQNKAFVYDLIFRTAAATLRTIAADPRHLGAEIGGLAVLHTWGQTLQHHPHVHCVVPGGGPSHGGTRWVSCRRGFFLPVTVLGRLFRGKLLDALRRAHEQQRLELHGRLEPLRQSDAFARWLSNLYDIDWVVYAKPPFGGPRQVLKYLARYTHRVAIANSRLLSMQDGHVTFGYKDYTKGARRRTLRLTAREFLRRWLLHILPKGFVRIRHFGWLANRCRQVKIAQCRQLLSAPAPSSPSDEASRPDTMPCPRCQCGVFSITREIAPIVTRLVRTPTLAGDTS